MEIKELEQEIQTAQDRMKQLDAEIERLKAERQTTEMDMKRLEKDRATLLFLRQIDEFTPEKATTVQLNGDVKTTPIMESFYYSQKQFLVFSRYFFVSSVWKHLSLIVVREQAVNYRDDKLTMTDLKKHTGMSLMPEAAKWYSKDRMIGLIEETLALEKEKLTLGAVVSFSAPIRLGGQTFSNQTGFGSEYYGTMRVSSGKLYGETTKFCIIGVQVTE